jgi:hypothetical protein
LLLYNATASGGSKMINNTNNYEDNSLNSEANVPFDEARASSTDKIRDKVPVDKLKDYGKKGLGPFIDVLHKYQGEFTPFFTSLSKGLKGGADALKEENSSDAQRQVSQWFQEAADLFSQAQEKLQSKNKNEIMDFLEEQSRRKPGFMFSSSYIAGLFFGRFGRQIGKMKFKGSEESKSESDVTSSLH